MRKRVVGKRSTGLQVKAQHLAECGVTVRRCGVSIRLLCTQRDDYILLINSHNMPLIEEIEDNEAGPSRSGPSLSVVLQELAARLALPEELLTSFMSGDIRKYSQGSS
jgi:hypothetical protein